MNKRIPRKSGQPAKSDKHSDLYTDEDPKGTIHGLKFATPEDAKASVSKIKSSGRSHAHKIQAAIAMEQRAKVMGKASAAAIYRSFINSMKDKTEDMKEDWSQKYKKSIDCSNPKGFSQRAHCQGRKKKMKEHIEEAVKMTALEKFRKAAAEREKKHAEIEKNRSKDGSGLTAAIDRLSKQVNKEAVELDEAHKVGDSVIVNSKFFGKQKGKVVKVDNQSVHVQRNGKKFSEKYPHDSVMKEEVEQIDEISDKLAGNYLKKVNTNLIKKVGMKPDLYNHLEPKRQKGATRALNRLMKPVKEDSPTNAAGTGAIAGLGVGPQGEPGVNMKKKKKVIPFAIFTRKMPN